ncbi:MAG TPA: hypothetical protein VF710_26045 [Longimicrobium sp.]|jgi:hypothetical protein
MCAEGQNTSGAAQVPDFTVVGFANPASTGLTTQAQASLEGVQAMLFQVCVSASYDPSTKKICFSVPIFGTVCITSPIPIPSGTLKACAQTCGIIPHGLQVTVYLNNNPIWSGTPVGHC